MIAEQGREEGEFVFGGGEGSIAQRRGWDRTFPCPPE